MYKLILPVLLSLFFIGFATAEDKKRRGPTNVQVSETELIREEKKTNVYPDTQDNLNYVFNSLDSSIKSLPLGENIAKVSTIVDQAEPTGLIIEKNITYLSSTYLYCALQNGTCPYFLEALFEIDLINSKIENKATCMNTLRFWRTWLDNDMEQRLSHATKITHIALVDKFNRSQRPKYTKCRKSIDKILADGPEDATEFFKERYSEDSEHSGNVEKSIKLLQAVKKDVPNIYEAVGLSKQQ